MTSEQVFQIWKRYHFIDGYHGILQRMKQLNVFDFTEENFDELLDLDLWKFDLTKQHKEDTQKLDREFVIAFRKENHEEMKQIKLENVKQDIVFEERYVDFVHYHYSDLEKQGLDYEQRNMLISLWDVNKHIKKLAKLKSTLSILLSNEELADLTEDDITAAREYPIDELLDFDFRGFVSCPYHEEKTASMSYWKKYNLAHCFGCGVTKDSIAICMDLHNKNFIEAVKFLNSDG